MGWYLRKSFSFGPLRINLSKSGLGGSVGVKGLRLGAGPKGSYLHGGRGGLYFRERLGAESPDTKVVDRAEVDEAKPKDGLARWLKGLFRAR